MRIRTIGHAALLWATRLLWITVVLSPVAVRGQSSTPLALKLAEGGQALAAGDLETAEKHYIEARDLQPGSALPWLGLAGVKEGQEDLTEALSLARRAEALAPDEPAVIVAVGRLLARLGAVGSALDTLDRARQLAPGNPQAALVAALLLRDAGRVEEAVKILEEARAHGPGPPELSEELGLLLLAADRPERARAVTAAALERHPRRPGLVLVQGLALAASGQEFVGEAIAWLAAALELGVASPGRVHLELGALLAGESRTEEALTHLRQARQLLPDSPEAQYRLGTALRTAGDLDGARAALERFRELSRHRDAEDWGAKKVGTTLNEAQALAGDNHLAAALERVEELLAEHPREARAWTLKAKVLFSMGRGREAVASIARARQLTPEKTEPHFLEGLFLMRLGRPAEAETALGRAVALDAALGEAWELLGGIAAKEDRPAEAAERFRRALDAGADGPGLRLGYASALEDLGRQQESAEQMEAYRRLKDGSGAG